MRDGRAALAAREPDGSAKGELPPGRLRVGTTGMAAPEPEGETTMRAVCAQTPAGCPAASAQASAKDRADRFMLGFYQWADKLPRADGPRKEASMGPKNMGRLPPAALPLGPSLFRATLL